jgi:hypothetical protein
MKKLPILLAALVPGLAFAEGNIALTGKIGTLGWGAELTTPLATNAHLRFGVNAYNWYADTTESGVDYDATWRTRTASLIGDFFPIQDSVFRISVGLFYNDNQLDMTAEPSSGNTYEINGTTYTAGQIGTLTGKLTFDKTSPYIGVGWGNAFAKPYGWNFVLDVGALYQGRPKLTLSTNSSFCNTDPTCQANLAAEQREAEEDLRSYRWYPVVSVGAVYRF